ncbi:hypothetical protein ACTD5D_34495 [Nocardia takedensis]|uniref:hypothetical protein n=1 Tax=Nocardia takedensis TaxID=259390 RepID=UPI0002F7A674|nr:hypothetical protein [Nocardia takedensis]
MPSRHRRYPDSGSPTVRAVVRDVVAAVARAETVLLDGLADARDAEITRALTMPRTRGDRLGFGVTDTAALITPIVWSAVVRAGRPERPDTWTRRAGLRLRARVPGRRAPARVPALTPEQLRETLARVTALGAERGLSEGDCATVTQALGARLAGQVRAEGDARGPADRR